MPSRDGGRHGHRTGLGQRRDRADPAPSPGLHHRPFRLQAARRLATTKSPAPRSAMPRSPPAERSPTGYASDLKEASRVSRRHIIAPVPSDLSRRSRERHRGGRCSTPCSGSSPRCGVPPDNGPIRRRWRSRFPRRDRQRREQRDGEGREVDDAGRPNSATTPRAEPISTPTTARDEQHRADGPIHQQQHDVMTIMVTTSSDHALVAGLQRVGGQWGRSVTVCRPAAAGVCATMSRTASTDCCSACRPGLRPGSAEHRRLCRRCCCTRPR